MWEFCINVEKKHQREADSLFGKLRKCFQDFNKIVISLVEEEDFRILIACDELEKSKVSFFMVDAVSDIICQSFKYEYLQEQLNLPMLNPENKEAFLKALVYFDAETDRYLVCKNLELGTGLSLEGFYHFKCRDLRRKWQELVNLANEHSSFLLSSETFADLLKFLIENLETRQSVVNVEKKGDEYFFYDENFAELKPEYEREGDVSLLSSLIALSPKKIHIFCEKNPDSETLTLITQIFGDKVRIMDKSAMPAIKNT